MRSSLVIVLITAVGMGVFALQNQNIIQVKFLKFAWNTSQSIVIMASVLFGFLGGVLTMLPGMFRRWRRVRSLEKEVGTLKQSQPSQPEIREEKEDKSEKEDVIQESED